MMSHATDVRMAVDRRASAGRVIVVERTGRWAIAMRAARSAHAATNRAASLRVVEARSFDECQRWLCRQKAALAVVEIEQATAPTALELLATIDRELPGVLAVAVADPALGDLEPVVRELGAVDFITTPRLSGTLVELALRHAAQQVDGPTTFAEQIRSSLPWGDD
jgi:hypothetical protein